MPRNEGRKGHRLGPYSKGSRGGVGCLLVYTDEQREADAFSAQVERLMTLPRDKQPAWLDEPLPLGPAARGVR